MTTEHIRGPLQPVFQWEMTKEDDKNTGLGNSRKNFVVINFMHD